MVAVADGDLIDVMRLVADGETAAVSQALDAAPGLVAARLATDATRATADGYFLARCHLQLYSGDTVLHVAAAAYDTPLARRLVAARADVRARNRRGAEPLHAATVGAPGSDWWNPRRQVAMITFLIAAGADPDAPAAGGVTPLHRAVRNRCSAAVRVLLASGADPRRPNDHGSTARELARWTTGRGGSGSPEAKAEQAVIVELLEAAR